jgi:ADP-heptose:LPS heptosyltransferase
MRIVEVTKDFAYNNISFKQGHRYVMAEDNEGQYRNVHGDKLGMSYPLETIYRPYNGQDLSNKRLTVWRTGGIGDLTFLLPVLVYLKKKYPSCFLRVATGCRQPLEHAPEINELYDMPFDAELLNDVDWHLMFQGIIESSSEISKKTHAVDMFFSYFKIDSTYLSAEEKRPKLYFNKEEMDWLSQTLPKLGIKEDDYVIGIQMETSSPLRNFPKEKFKTVIDIFAKEKNTKIVLIGAKQQETLGNFYKGNSSNVIVATGFTVRESIILVTRYDLVIAPDSFIIQIAGALEKPLVGLYGPFASEVRMKYFKNAIGLDPSVVCSPCFKHDFRPCIKGFPSPCFTQLKTEDVLQAADYLKFKFTGQHFFFMHELLKAPDLPEVEKYMLSADKGLCFFGGFYTHSNIIRIDTNPFFTPDISDINKEFTRESYPFVLYMGPVGFSPKNRGIYDNCKGLIRPGGYLMVHMQTNASEQFFDDVKKDIGMAKFIFLHSKFESSIRSFTIIARKPY